MMKKKLYIPMLLCLLLVTACRSETTTNETEYVAEISNTETETADLYNEYGDMLPDGLDYGGYEYRVLLHGKGNVDDAWCSYIEIAEENGATLNDAAYKRNQEVMDRLNITIKACEDATWTRIPEHIIKTVMADEDAYDLSILSAVDNYTQLATQNVVLDFKEVPHINLEADYYFQKAIDAFTIADKSFFLNGEYTYTMLSSVYMLFNKTMLDQYDLESPYTLVDDGKWTIDKMIEMSKGIYADLNGNGEIDFGDRFGMASNNGMFGYFWGGINGEYVNFDDNGMLRANIANEKNQILLEKLVAWLNTEDVFNIDGKSWDTFFDGNALFCFYGSSLTKLRDVDSFDFGFVPSPKYDEAQDTYDTYTAGGFAVMPITVRDTDRNGVITEALYSASHRYMADAYIESYAENKILRDEESQRMFRMTLQNGYYSISSSIDPTGYLIDYKFFFDLVKERSTGLASSWAEIESTVNAAYKEITNEVIASHDS